MSTPLEKRILQFGLTLASLYQLYQVANGFIVNATTIPLNVAIGFFFLLFLALGMRLKNITWLAFFLHLIMLPVLVYFWKEFGGLAGTVPMILYVYITLIISTLHGALLMLTLVFYLIVFVALSVYPGLTGIPVFDPSKVEDIQLAIDFFVIALIITIYLIYVKDRLITYRGRVSHRHHQLQHLSSTLQEQNEALHVKQEETMSINENLENIVEERINGIEEKNRELAEYAFINAHLLRAPICRLLGIINLMEIERKDEQIASLKEKALFIDRIVRRVNDMM
ncbi:MAG TPA: hypothetical protein VFW11_01490 [Cyclobacteriaceae bacterium]|nr:hypothetical protein [Cyclobacteriaceae bacterium]